MLKKGYLDMYYLNNTEFYFYIIKLRTSFRMNLVMWGLVNLRPELQYS